MSNYQDIEEFGGYGLGNRPAVIQEIEMIRYICPICGYQYSTRDDAISCASRPISGDKGVGIGDMVRITCGEGNGELAKVTKIGVFDKHYGHYQWQKLWHTVWVEADLINSWGTRTLCFDDYEVV